MKKPKTLYFTREKNGVVFSTRRHVMNNLKKQFNVKTGRQWKKLLRVPSFALMFQKLVEQFNYDLNHNRKLGSL